MRLTFRLMGIVAAWLAAAMVVSAQVPQMINYQSRVSPSFNGTGYFKFAFVDNTRVNAYWSNDGTWVLAPGAAVPMPVNPVQITVDKGLYSVMLGNPTPPLSMVTVPPSVFQNPIVYLRVWFSDNPAGPFVLQTPDLRVTSVGYAMNAETVVDGAINEFKLADKAVTVDKLVDGAVTSSKLAPDAITTTAIKNSSITDDKLAPNAVNGAKLADDIDLGAPATSGSLQVWAGDATGGPAAAGIQLEGASRRIDLNQKDGTKGVQLTGDRMGNNSGGAIELYNGDGGAARVSILGNASGAGRISVRDASGDITTALGGSEGALTITGNSKDAVSLRAQDGGQLDLYQGDGRAGVALSGNAYGNNSGGAVKVFNGSHIAVHASVDYGNGGGFVSVNNTNGSQRVLLDGYGKDAGGDIIIENDNGTQTMVINGAEGSGQGGQLLLYNGSHSQTIQIDGDAPNSEGWIGVYRNGKASPVIELDAYDSDGNARITTEVLEIKGGSDLSENFDITTAADAPQPGMVVCIDPERPGQLMVSSKPYDHAVAGIVSGAGGVKPGMMMGQRGTVADGKYPVALTGRVYCIADASNGAIQPGDLLTTSDVQGHAMRTADPLRVSGAIIGKAMTSLENGTGLVLVLISLQ